MSQVVFSTYDGRVAGYDLVLEENGLKFDITINTQIGTSPVRALAFIKGNIFISNGTLVNKFNFETKRQVGSIQLKDRVDQMLVMDGKLLVVHSYQADIYDPSTCDNLMSYKTGQHLITKACVYAKNKFCLACAGKLLAYCANSSQPVAEMKIDDHITDM